MVQEIQTSSREKKRRGASMDGNNQIGRGLCFGRCVRAGSSQNFFCPVLDNNENRAGFATLATGREGSKNSVCATLASTTTRSTQPR